MKIKKSKLERALRNVRAGLSTGRETVVQAGCFVFKDGNVMTFNDEIYCSMPCPVGFEGAVAAKSFETMLERFTDDTLTLELTGHELIVRGNRKRAGFNLEAEVLLPVSEVTHPDDDAWVEADPGLSQAFGNVASCVGNDEEKFYRTCVNVTPGWVEACDNYHMMRAPVATVMTEEESFLVRGQSVAPLHGLGVEHVATTSDWLCFSCLDGLRYYCRRYIDDFPNLTAYYGPCDGAPFAAPAGFVEGLESAQIFTGENEVESVKVDMRAGKMKLLGRGATGWFEQILEVDYHDRPISFSAPPKLLRKFAEKHGHGQLTESALRMTTDEYIYITSLDAS